MAKDTKDLKTYFLTLYVASFKSSMFSSLLQFWLGYLLSWFLAFCFAFFSFVSVLCILETYFLSAVLNRC